MISSREEAFLLLNKWRDEIAPLKVMVVGGKSAISAMGTLTTIVLVPASLELRGPSGYCLLDLRGATFGYEDPAEAPAEVRAESRELFTELLDIRLASGDRCAIFRLVESTPKTATRH